MDYSIIGKTVVCPLFTLFIPESLMNTLGALTCRFLILADHAGKRRAIYVSAIFIEVWSTFYNVPDTCHMSTSDKDQVKWAIKKIT